MIPSHSDPERPESPPFSPRFPATPAKTLRIPELYREVVVKTRAITSPAAIRSNAWEIVVYYTAPRQPPRPGGRERPARRPQPLGELSRAPWGGTRQGKFLAGQIALVQPPSGRPLALAVAFHPDVQPPTDDPGRTAAPRGVELVMEAVQAALQKPAGG